ncbi:MAG: protein kinase [Acidobacteria bacterium]|nr:protein kinase [Acidobacteriota bacterium]
MVLLGSIATAVCILGSALIGRYRTTAIEARADNLYDLREQIGEGGMGEVWLAEHKTLARPAAIKIVRPDLLADGSSTAGAQAVKRFAREAQATAGLRSPNTVEIYDFGVTGEGVFYYVMEYLDGFDLGTLVERHGPLPVSRAVHLLRQACESLEDAHQHALIHRDIKPANIFACRLGTANDFVKVLDFGLVKDQRPTEMTQLTVDGLTTGTPAYMAPEMALQNGDVGPTTDVYALGCVAYWLVTGKLVFDDTTPVAMIVSHVKNEPEPPSARTELPIPAELDAIILRCLAKDPADRYPGMQALADALDNLQLSDSWDRGHARDWWAMHRPDSTLPELAQAS